LDGIIASVKALMKNDPKGRRPTVSPLKKSAVIEKDKTSKRLIDRVEKALIQQSAYTHTSK
jgi:Asp-tRNA(Asn)/Glu-tRNA(Gln) amidotransferase C subunit